MKKSGRAKNDNSDFLGPRVLPFRKPWESVFERKFIIACKLIKKQYMKAEIMKIISLQAINNLC